MAADEDAVGKLRLSDLWRFGMHFSGERRNRALKAEVVVRLSRFPRCVRLLSWVLVLLPAFLVLQPCGVAADVVAWWDGSFGYRQQLTVANNSDSILPAGYSVCLSLDHFSLAEAGKSLENGYDVRVVYWNGLTNVELDRVNESYWDTPGTNTQVWFKTQTDIAASVADDGYFLYYGNKDATPPPADRKNVYEFFDDFSGYDARQYDTSVPGVTDLIKAGDEQVWKIQSGIWNVENDTQPDGTTGKVLSHDSVSGIYTYAYVLNKDYDNVAVEVKMRTKSGEYGGYWPFGARLDPATGANYTAWSYTDYSKILKFSTWAAPSVLVTGTTRPGMGNSWHTLRFTLDGDKLNLYFDGASCGCYVQNAALTSGTVFAMGSGNRKMHFDDFKVRKYTTNEPSVLAAPEEKLIGRPAVSFDRKWHLKGDGHTPADNYLGVSVSLPEAAGVADAQASYVIQETALSGTLSRTDSTTWEGQVNISGLQTGTFHLVATVSDTTWQSSSDPVVFHVSYPFYHVWTIDWEGGYVARAPYLDSLAYVADEHGIPMTQLFNPRIYVWSGMPEWQKNQMTQWVLQRKQTKGDEIGLHLHMYTDFVDEADVARVMSPHWENRTDGYDCPFANYDYVQSRALLNLAIQLFQTKGLGRPTSFRAGGWFADEENLKALSDMGFLLDASGGTFSLIGNLPSPWTLNVTSQPYYPCSEDQNTSDCLPGDSNLTLLEIPNNLAHTNGIEDRRPKFDSNYPRTPLEATRVGVLLSHDRSGVGTERAMIEQYFAHVDSFLYVTDRGAVVYVTLDDVREAITVSRPVSPDLLGPPEMVSGGLVQQGNEDFDFHIKDRDSVDLVRYRIQVSYSPDYDLHSGMTVDYVSGFCPQGGFRFAMGQPESTGTYYRGGESQVLGTGSYYWRVMTIDHNGESSWWSPAHSGAVAFTVEGTADVGNGPDGTVAVPLAVSFCNPSGPSVLMKTQVPAVGNAMLRIFSCSGRLVRTLPLDGLRAGAYSIFWDGRDSQGRGVSAGVYFVELSQNGRAITKKLVLVK